MDGLPQTRVVRPTRSPYLGRNHAREKHGVTRNKYECCYDGAPNLLSLLMASLRNICNVLIFLAAEFRMKRLNTFRNMNRKEQPNLVGRPRARTIKRQNMKQSTLSKPTLRLA